MLFKEKPRRWRGHWIALRARWPDSGSLAAVLTKPTPVKAYALAPATRESPRSANRVSESGRKKAKDESTSQPR